MNVTKAHIQLAEALAARPAEAAAVLDAALRADPVRHASAWRLARYGRK